MFTFVSVKLVGSLACPTTARSHLTALVFLGEERVAVLARVPLVGEDWLLVPLDAMFGLPEGSIIVLLVEGLCVCC